MRPQCDPECLAGPEIGRLRFVVLRGPSQAFCLLAPGVRGLSRTPEPVETVGIEPTSAIALQRLLRA